MRSYRPSLEEFRHLCERATVVPVSREILGDGLTPVMASAIVGGEDGSFLLESVIGGEKWARYSFVGFEPDCIVRGVGDRYEELTAEGVHVQRVDDPWDALRERMAQYDPPEVPWLPRFWGGAVGYVAYDAVRRFEPTVGNRHPAGDDEYDFAFSIGGTVLIFDNRRQTIRIVVPALVGEGRDVEAAYQQAVERIERAAERIRRPATLREMPFPDRDANPELPRSNFDPRGYRAAVEQAKEHIRAGDIFQVVLSQRFTVPSDDVDPFDVYRALRALNPSPYMYFLRFPHVRIAGASPEVLVRLEQGTAEVRPIAGTRRRTADPEQDRVSEEEMLADPKERAEHVMLVDLGRNDLGRISLPGTVRVTERMVVEHYSHVMHIVSNVVGKLNEGRDAIDVIRATFPAGTLSGAPKVRAMQIIEALEPERRGVYGGAVGYLGFDGNMDVAIAIRTVVERDGEFRVQAGAGIVEASDPQAEYEETVSKARAALLAVDTAARGE